MSSTIPTAAVKLFFQASAGQPGSATISADAAPGVLADLLTALSNHGRSAQVSIDFTAYGDAVITSTPRSRS